MRRETMAIHSGYEDDPTTKAVAVPIYQTVAYSFDSADHGAALFNLEVEGFRYSRISNPTNAVLERRVAALEGGLEALRVSSGQAALYYAALNLTHEQWAFVKGVSNLAKHLKRGVLVKRAGESVFLDVDLSGLGPLLKVYRSGNEPVRLMRQLQQQWGMDKWISHYLELA